MVQTFKTKTELKGKTIIKFTATWCGPCKKIAPVFEKLSSEYKDISFYEVDVDIEEEFCNKMNVNSMPTFIFFNNGQEYKRLSGSNSSELETNVRLFNQVM